MLPAHVTAAPQFKYIGNEAIEVKKLDSILPDLCKASSNFYMKIDTQGYESNVLKGAEKSLVRIDTIQLEMSLVPLYEGEMLFIEMCMNMKELGYQLISLEPGFCDSDSGQLLQVDGVFHRF